MSKRTDTERLEWLANRQCQFLNHGPRNDDPRSLINEAGEQVAYGTDLRQMIDAAMDAEERG